VPSSASLHPLTTAHRRVRRRFRLPGDECPASHGAARRWIDERGDRAHESGACVGMREFDENVECTRRPATAMSHEC